MTKTEELNITIFMAISVDGFIVGKNGETPWSDEEWKNYQTYLKKSDCLIIGRTTYDIMENDGDFDALGNPNVIVVTTTPIENVLCSNSPEGAIEIAKQQNWKNIIVGGGKILNSYFIKNNTAQYLHLDIEPVVLNGGLKLFEEENDVKTLSLLNSETLNSGTISIDYSIES